MAFNMLWMSLLGHVLPFYIYTVQNNNLASYILGFFSDLWHRKLRDIKKPVNIMVINDVSKVENCNDVYSLYTFNRVDIYIYIFSSEGGW